MSDHLRTQQNITQAGARAALEAALAHSEAKGYKMNIAVVDAGGHLVAFARMDDAMVISTDIAIDKAYSVVIGGGLPTSGWHDILTGDEDPGLKIGFPHRDRLVVFGGGVAINIDGQVVGAVGVSGGSAAEDAEVASAGAAAVS